MTPPTAETVRDVLSQGQPDEATRIIQQLDPGAAAEVLAALPLEEQRILFRRLPVEFAAALVSHFPYYHEYVLLHLRPIAEMRAIVDRLDPTERMRFFDELPEEAWQRVLLAESQSLPSSAEGDHLESQN
jgi:Mg/Co/Ni transporter MgtE